MQITTASAGMAALLAPAAAPSEPRASEPGATGGADTTAESTAAAFDAMLAALVGPTVAGNQPTPATAESEEVVDAGTEAPASDAHGADVAATGDAQAMEALHYGLRTDAQLTTPRTGEPGEPGEPASTQGRAAHERRDARHQLSGHGRGSAAHDAARAERLAARQDADATSEATETAADVDAAADDARFDMNGVARSARSARADRAAEAAAATPSRDVEALAPELQSRLERVVDRMREEFGYDVEVVETTRSQARQDDLFAQGRTRPGPVVTWTRSSQHTAGLAVDVRIDGSWENAEAFTTLQRIAREEGLKTLGPRDAGHLELPRHLAREIIDADAHVAAPSTGAAPAATPQPAPASPVPASVVSPVADVAPVAAVAHVARVAEVATVAGVATANVTDAAPADGRPGVRTARGPRAGAPPETRARRNDERGERGERGEGAPGLQVAAATPAGQHAPRFAPAAPPVLGAAAVDRLTSVTDRLEAAAASRGVSHLTLRLDNALGGEDQIRIDVRGMTVDTQIDLGDAGAAARLGDRVGELRQALERQGLTADTVRISSAGAKAAESANAAPVEAGRAAAASGVAAGANAGDAGSARDGSSQSQHQQPRESMQRDAQQHGSRDGRRGHDAEPWLADEFTPRGRSRGAYGTR